MEGGERRGEGTREEQEIILNGYSCSLECMISPSPHLAAQMQNLQAVIRLHHLNRLSNCTQF